MLEIKFRSLWFHIDYKHRIIWGKIKKKEKSCNLRSLKEQRIPLEEKQGLELKGQQEEQFP